jgi:Zn-finger nucleic acid-binding protein
MMECPKCKGVKLEKTDLSKPYWCPVCGGVWVSMEEISRPFAEDIDPALFDSLHYDGKTGLCPLGHGIMIRAKIEGDYDFYLERCSHCGGVWFDHGEWQQIAKHKLVDNLSHFWTAAWQRKNMQEKEREIFIDRNKTLIGEEIVEKILELGKILKNHPEKSRALALLKQEIQ